jgi:hypothetical protein
MDPAFIVTSLEHQHDDDSSPSRWILTLGGQLTRTLAHSWCVLTGFQAGGASAQADTGMHGHVGFFGV